MSDRMKMSDTLRRLRDLYEGRFNDEAAPGEMGQPEIDELREMKDLLDARPKRRPDPSSVAAVLAAARGDYQLIEQRAVRSEPADESGSALRGKRVDRPPQARRQSAVLRLGTVSALVALLVGVIGILQLDLLGPDANTAVDRARSNQVAGAEEGRAPTAEEPAASMDDDARESSEESGSADDEAAAASAPTNVPAVPPPPPNDADVSFADVRPERSAAPAAARSLAGAFADSFAGPPSYLGPVGPQVESLAGAEQSDVLSWDHQGDVMEVYQHIEMIGGDVAMEWESPSVPLEMMPASRAGERFVRPAGERRTP